MDQNQNNENNKKITKKKINGISINQTKNLISVATETGFEIYNLDPLEFKKEVSISS